MDSRPGAPGWSARHHYRGLGGVKLSIRSFALICATLLLLAAQATFCLARTDDPVAEGLAVDFKDIELPELIQTISELTGKNFVYDETVRGKVTIISPQRMTLDEAYQVFLSVLNVKGYTVIPSGSINKIVLASNARESNLPTIMTDGEKGRGEHYVTQLVPLQNIDAGEIATTVLAPLIPKSGNIVAYAPTNTLIITDSAANIKRLVEILRQLDIPGNSDTLEVIELQYANAEEIAKLVTQLLAQRAATPAGRRAAAKVATAGDRETGKIIAFPPTNMLVAMTTVDEIETIRSIVARLDRKPSQARSGIQVYYLENADAETLAGTLNEILTGLKAQTPAANGDARAGSPQQQRSLREVTITADKPTNSLIINSTPEEYEKIHDIIRQLDIKRKQVYVEALILELSMDATKKVGSSLQGAVETGSENVVFGRSSLNTDNLVVDPENPLASAINGILLGGIFNPITVIAPDGTEVTVPALSALIDLSKQDNDVNILSAPRLLTSDNEEAEIVVGQNVPIITSRLTDTGGTGLAQSVAVERKDVALTLRFTPQITEGNLVRLNVFQEITDLAQSNVGNVNDVGPTLTTRRLRNAVLAENGRTVVLGGLINSNVQESVTKVPLLGDIPILGWAFKRKTTAEEKNNLLIFITPHIIKDASDLAAVTSKAKEAMEKFQSADLKDRAGKKAWAEEQISLPPTEPALPGAN